MSLGHLLRQTVTIIRRPLDQSDKYGMPTAGLPVETSTVGRLEQVATSEHLADRDTAASRYRVFLPADSDVGMLDELQIDGAVYRVVGEPQEQRSPRGVHHLDVLLERLSDID